MSLRISRRGICAAYLDIELDHLEGPDAGLLDDVVDGRHVARLRPLPGPVLGVLLEDRAAASLLTMRPANSSNDTRVSHVPYDRLFRTAFWEGSAGFSRPVKLAGAFSSKQWAVAALAELLPGDHLQLDVRIDPTQPQGSFAERIRMYQRHEVGQVNQVLA